MTALSPNAIDAYRWSQHREVTGAPVAADVAPDAAFPVRRALLNAQGYDTILVSVRLDGGVAPTVSLQPLLYDEAEDDFALHDVSDPLSDNETIEVSVHSGRAFLRIDAVAGNPTTVEIRIKGGQPSNRPNG